MKKLAEFSQYNEASIKGLLNDADVRSGVCLALSAEWLRLVLYNYQNGVDSESLQRMKLLSTGFDTCVSHQKKYAVDSARLKKEGVKVLDRTRTALTIALMDNADTVHPEYDANPGKVALNGNSGLLPIAPIQKASSTVFREGTGHLVLITMNFQNGSKGRHATAAYCPKGGTYKLVTFDANSGEYGLSDRTELWSFVIDVCKLCKGELKTVRLLEVKQGPPPMLGGKRGSDVDF